MSTILITYSIPPHPSTHPDGPPAAGATAPHAGAAPSVAATIAGLDEGIAAAMSDELTRSGHHVTCRPAVAVPTTDGFDLVVEVDRLRVTHATGTLTTGGHPAEPRSDTAGPPARGEESSIPLTWCADWRAVEAWARTIGEQLVHLLDVRAELARVRAELDRCRGLAAGATSETRPGVTAPAVHPVGREAVPNHHRGKRLVRTSPAPGA
jgi:hypothetical protein